MLKVGGYIKQFIKKVIINKNNITGVISSLKHYYNPFIEVVKDGGILVSFCPCNCFSISFPKLTQLTSLLKAYAMK